jgi:hypothetical protein
MNRKQKINKEDSAVSVVNALFSVIFQINIYIKKIGELKKANDNKQFLSTLPGLIQNILDLKIEMINVIGIIQN